eukprot:symbB.v1.2.027438.t1/scaffold2812.1/size71925/3
MNLPRLAKYYAELRITDELEHVSRFLRKMLPRYTSHQLALTAHAFGIAKLQDKDMMAKIARLIAPRLSEITPLELLRLAQAYADTEVCHYTLLAQVSAQMQVRVQQAATGQVIPGSCPSFTQLTELSEAFAQLKFQDYSFFEMLSLQAQTLLLEGHPGPTPLMVLFLACAMASADDRGCVLQKALGKPRIRDNYVYFTRDRNKPNVQVQLNETSHSVTQGQPYEGVFTLGYYLDVRAGCHESSEVADDFNAGITGENALGLYTISDSLPEELNFEVFGTLSVTIDDTARVCPEMRIAQGHYPGMNNCGFYHQNGLMCRQTHYHQNGLMCPCGRTNVTFSGSTLADMPSLAKLCQSMARLKVHDVRLFEVIMAHVAEHWYDYPATTLAEIGAALSPIMPPGGEVEDVYRKMFSQIRSDRDTLSLRGVAAAACFMAEVDHKGEFLPGFFQALAQRLMSLKDETRECYDVARVTEIFSRRCPEEHALFSTLCRHLHRHLGFFEPVDFVRFTRGLAATEYRDERVTHALPKWAQKRHKEFSKHDWDSFVTSLAQLGASESRQSHLREIGPPVPEGPSTFSGGMAAQGG